MYAVLFTSDANECQLFCSSSSPSEGLKLNRKMISTSTGVWTMLDKFLIHNRKQKLNRLATEMRLSCKGFDVTDYLEVKLVFNWDGNRFEFSVVAKNRNRTVSKPAQNRVVLWKLSSKPAVQPVIKWFYTGQTV